MTQQLTISDIRERATINPSEAANLLGMNRDTLYRALESGALPSIRVGPRRLLVPVPALLAQLGADVPEPEPEPV